MEGKQMRILFTIYPNSIAHLYPVAPLAWALQSAGHEVRIAAHHSSAEQISTTGLTPVALGDPAGPPVRLTDDCSAPKSPEEVERYAEVMGLDEVDRERWIHFFQYLFVPISDYVRVDRSEAADLVDFARAWRPDLVIWDVTIPAGAVAARACGAAHARLVNGEDVLAYSLDRLDDNADRLRAAGLDPNPLATMLAPLAERYGMEVDRDLLVGQWSIDTLPLSPPSRTVRIRMRHVPYAGPDTFPSWLYEEPVRPRIAMSLGESTRRFIVGDWDRAPKIMQALDGLDLDVVATLNSAQLHGIEKVPDNVRTIDWVNLNHLLPTCSALIHHGGIGTYSAAVAAKVPQLVCDIAGESLLLKTAEERPDALGSGLYQTGVELGLKEETAADGGNWELPAKKIEAFVISEFAINHGAGERLDHRNMSVEQLRDLIWRVATGDSYRRGAAAVYEQWLGTPSPSEIVPVLERMTAEYGGGSRQLLRRARTLAATVDRQRAEIDVMLTSLTRRYAS
jgi:UDP:flavonoid glycosyltransferase YjiC (YdhE family)